MVDTKKLSKGANLAIPILSQRLIEDVTWYKHLSHDNNDELRKALHLRIVVTFSLLELTTIEKAMLATSHAYAKRYHYKNLVANTSECYKVLYHFKGFRKKSIWTRIEKIIPQTKDKSLSTKYRHITDALIEFGEKMIDKELREMTMHYAEQMITVYQMTVNLNNEDDAVRYFCEFNDILREMLSFSNELVAIYNHKDYKSDECYTIKTTLIGDQKFKTFMQVIDSHKTLMDTLQHIIPKGSQELDEMAHQENKIERLRDFIMRQPYMVKDDSLSLIIKFHEIQLLMRFMMLDIAANLEAFCNSTSSIEAALNARRFVIPQVSMLTLLYRYTEDERDKSFWRLVEGLIPKAMYDLRKRHAAVHVYDDKGNNLLPEFIDVLEKMNYVEELVHIKIVADFYSIFVQFMVELQPI